MIFLKYALYGWLMIGTISYLVHVIDVLIHPDKYRGRTTELCTLLTHVFFMPAILVSSFINAWEPGKSPKEEQLKEQQKDSSEEKVD